MPEMDHPALAAIGASSCEVETFVLPYGREPDGIQDMADDKNQSSSPRGTAPSRVRSGEWAYRHEKGPDEGARHEWMRLTYDGRYVARFMDKGGVVDIEQVADAFRMAKGQLAETTGLSTATLSKADRRDSPKAQNRVTEMLEIIGRIRDWAGGEAQAMAWYRSQPIPALDGRTSEALVKSGRAGAVRDYLDHLALGGFA